MIRVGRVKMRGFQRVQNNLNAALAKMKYDSTAALTEVAMEIHSEADFISPTIPEDTSNLRNSRFIVNNLGRVAWGSHPRFSSKDHWGRYKRGAAREAYIDHLNALQKYMAKATLMSKKKDPVVILGYSVDYAVYPHEMGKGSVRTGQAIKWTRPGSGPKFFQAAMDRKRREILWRVKKEAGFYTRKKLPMSTMKALARRTRR
jgi:hypothetical protein